MTIDYEEYEKKLVATVDAYIAANPGNHDYPPELNFTEEEDKVCDVDGPHDQWMLREIKFRARIHFITESGMGRQMVKDLWDDMHDEDSKIWNDNH